MYRIVILIHFLIMAAVVSHSFGALTVHKDNISEFTATFTLTDFRLDNVEGVLTPQFSDASIHQIYDNGTTLPVLSLYLGIPHSGNPQITVTPVEVETKVITAPLTHTTETSQTLTHKSTWHSIPVYKNFRQFRAAHFYLTPLRYDQQSKQLTILKKARITVTYPNAPTTTAISYRSIQGDYYDTVKDLFLNFNTALNWYKKRQQSMVSTQPYIQVKNDYLHIVVGDGRDGFNEGTTNENRFIRITYDKIQELSRRSLKFSDIAVLASLGHELDSLAPSGIKDLPTGVTAQTFITYDKDEDGKFDKEDYIIIHVTGASDWKFNNKDTLNIRYDYRLNRIDDYRHYWITVNEDYHNKLNTFKEPQENSRRTVRAFKNYKRYKQSHSFQYETFGIKPYTSLDWVWTKLDIKNTELKFDLSLPHIDKEDHEGEYSIKVGYITPAICTLETNVTNEPFQHLKNSWQKIDKLKEDFKLSAKEYTMGISKVAIQIAHVDFRYNCDISLKDKKYLRVLSPVDAPEVVTYELRHIPDDKKVIILREKDGETTIVYNQKSSKSTYQWKDTTGVGVQYIIATEDAYKSNTDPKEMEKVTFDGNKGYEIRDLHNKDTRSDYLVIASSFFREEAERLVKLKNKTSQFSKAKFVTVDNIYREFSGGAQSYRAIRNFLMYASLVWEKSPDYVLLLGSGHFDYKNHLYMNKREPNHVPPAILSFKVSEDFFTYHTPQSDPVNDSTVPSIFLGRVAAVTKEDANNFIDKVHHMEISDSSDGDWRNRILLMSDDDVMETGTVDFIKHYYSNNLIYDTIRAHRPATDIRRLLLFEYPWDHLKRKPLAREALVNHVNTTGVSLINYFGHGSENALTDEKVFNRSATGQLQNKYRYPTIALYSCSVGHFDVPHDKSLADMLVTQRDGGAIVSIASTQIAYAGPNTILAQGFTRALYDPVKQRSVGQAYALSKSVKNLRRYALFGDPSIRYYKQTDNISFDLYNHKGKKNDTLKALTMVKLKGEIRKGDKKNSNFGNSTHKGYLSFSILAPDQDSVTRKDGGTFSDPKYTLQGRTLFTSVTPVKNGTFSQEIFLPQDLPFETDGSNIRLYAWSENKNEYALGYKSNIYFVPNNSTPDDKEGPRITVKQKTSDNKATSVVDTIKTTLPLTLEILLWDETALGVSSESPGQGLQIELNNSMQNLNKVFKYDDGKQSSGKASITLTSAMLPQDGATYPVTIIATDILGNRTKKTLVLSVAKEPPFTISNVFNFPNPAEYGKGTRFYYNNQFVSKAVPIETTVEIKIFTLSGRLIRTLTNAPNGYLWNLTDQMGNKLTPNVYLYRVYSYTKLDNNEVAVRKSSIKRLVVQPGK